MGQPLSAREDYLLELALGNVTKRSDINKFGRTPNADNGVATDIWDAAAQPVWLAPTAARIHTIASSDAADDTGSTGANSVTIYYLSDWDTPETSETVTGDLNAGIAMTNAAVMINRMHVNPQATSTSTNEGIITATAASDATVTSQIAIGAGQTRQAIYGIASTQSIHLGRIYGNMVESNTSSEVAISLSCNPNPDVQTLAYISQHTFGIRAAGTSALTINYFTRKTFNGPCILKISAISDANDTDVSAGFDGIIVTN